MHSRGLLGKDYDRMYDFHDSCVEETQNNAKIAQIPRLIFLTRTFYVSRVKITRSHCEKYQMVKILGVLHLELASICCTVI